MRWNEEDVLEGNENYFSCWNRCASIKNSSNWRETRIVSPAGAGALASRTRTRITNCISGRSWCASMKMFWIWRETEIVSRAGVGALASRIVEGKRELYLARESARRNWPDFTAREETVTESLIGGLNSAHKVFIGSLDPQTLGSGLSSTSLMNSLNTYTWWSERLLKILNGQTLDTGFAAADGSTPLLEENSLPNCGWGALKQGVMKAQPNSSVPF